MTSQALSSPRPPGNAAAGFTFIGALASLAFLGTLAAVAAPLLARRLGSRTPAATAAVIRSVETRVTRDLEHIGTVAAAYAERWATKLPPPLDPLPAAVPDLGPEPGPRPVTFWEIPAPPPFWFPRPPPPPVPCWRPRWVRPGFGHGEGRRPPGRVGGRRR